jgi:hypothetical protein
MASPHVDAESTKDDDKDISQILTPEERGELTLLLANITEIMRQQIRNIFDASITSTTKPHEVFQVTGKTSNPSASDLHKETDEEEKERKLHEKREKELSEPKMLELKLEALKFFDQWRESVILRVGNAVNNPQEVLEEQKRRASVDETPDAAVVSKPQAIRKQLTSIFMGSNSK